MEEGLEIFFYTSLFHFMCMNVLPACLCRHHMHTWCPSLGPLEEQPLLPTEPSLQSPSEGLFAVFLAALLLLVLLDIVKSLSLNQIWLCVSVSSTIPDLSVSPCSTLSRRSVYMQSGKHSTPKTILAFKSFMNSGSRGTEVWGRRVFLRRGSRKGSRPQLQSSSSRAGSRAFCLCFSSSSRESQSVVVGIFTQWQVPGA